jgi:glutamine amidotransferase
MQNLIVIDYGAGNLHSVEKALTRAAAEAGLSVDITRSADPGAIADAERLILPGVGAFAACRAGLDAQSGLVPAILGAVTERRVPLLGICVGMQLLATAGEEFGETPGLDLIPGRVRRIEAPGLRLPHMGWNRVEGSHPVLPGAGDAYFVHSFAFTADDPGTVLATAEYGQTIPAMIGAGSVLGVQFHPEKSGTYGLALLGRFLDWRPV